MDGRAVPLLTVSPARRVKWQQRQGFSIAKESTFPCEHTVPYARSACSCRQRSHVHRESHSKAFRAAVRACVPAAVLFSGRNALHRRFLTVVALLRGRNREMRSVPLDRASRTAALPLWKVNHAHSIRRFLRFYALMRAARIEVGDAAFLLPPCRWGLPERKEHKKSLHIKGNPPTCWWG